jgi:ABC-2 type transport system permease protein
VNSLVAARAASDVASALAPTPSSIAFQRAMETELNDEREATRRLEARKAALLEQHGVSSVDALPVNFRGISLQEGEAHGNEVFDRHYGQLFGQYAKQDLASRLGGLVAPLLSMRALSMGLAGTDLAHHRDFVTAAEGYRREIQRLLNADIAVNSKAGAVYEAGPELWAKVPEFVYAPPTALSVAGAHLLDLGLLGLWLTAAVVFVVRGTVTLGAD